MSDAGQDRLERLGELARQADDRLPQLGGRTGLILLMLREIELHDPRQRSWVFGHVLDRMMDMVERMLEDRRMVRQVDWRTFMELTGLQNRLHAGLLRRRQAPAESEDLLQAP